MARRLGIRLDDEQFEAVRAAAAAEKVSVAQWVRSALRSAQRERSHKSVESKLTAIRRAASYAAPIADLEQINGGG